MKHSEAQIYSNRRSFLKKGVVAGAATVGAGLLGAGKVAFGRSSSSSLNKGDVAILRFLAAAELIESDLWIQYAELGGIGDNPPIEIDPNEQLNNYQIALSNLDGDGPQYITSNTIDEISHAAFLNGYLESKGADPVDFDEFRTLQGSTATGAQDIGRLNNVTAIPRTNKDFDGATNPNFPGNDHIQAIANVAAFHFGYIEQGGSSLYAALGQKISSLEVLKIAFGIGGDEVAHFLEWVDFAGNGVQAPVAPFKDSISGLSFPDFFNNPPLQPPGRVQPSLIFPVPCEFISPDLPHCAVIRPSDDKFGGAVATIASFTADGLFVGQTPKFFQVVQQLAEEADAATREL
jgi:hypothetical protein